MELAVFNCRHKGMVKINLLLVIISMAAPFTHALDSYNNGPGIILGVPYSKSDLPRSEPMLPGHTLLRPTFGMLKSAIKFPHKDLGGFVDGNPDNIGLKYGGKDEYLAYSSFRRDSRDQNVAVLLNSILKAVKEVSEQEFGQPHPEVLLAVEEPKAEYVRPPNLQLQLSPLSGLSNEVGDENRGAERPDSSEESDDGLASWYRRSRRKSRSDSSSSSDKDWQKNPGNPFTVYKDRYKKNWLWNFKMTGDHMNINPYAPSFGNGPTGADMFFSRKWWYFNQDDFVPF